MQRWAGCFIAIRFRTVSAINAQTWLASNVKSAMRAGMAAENIPKGPVPLRTYFRKEAGPRLLRNYIKIKEHQKTKHDTIPAKHLEIVLPDIAHQEGNDQHGNHKSGYHTDDQQQDL